MQLDDAVVLSGAGRAAVQRELTDLLRSRRNMREHRSRGLREAFGSDGMLLATHARCADLCADLGFSNEIEAENVLLEGNGIGGSFDDVDMATPGAERTVKVESWPTPEAN